MRRLEGFGRHAVAASTARERTRTFSPRPVNRFLIAAILARGCREPGGQRLVFHALRDELGTAFPGRRMRAIPRGARDQGGEARRLRRREAARADAEEGP